MSSRRRSRRSRAVAVAPLALVALAVACGGDDGDAAGVLTGGGGDGLGSIAAALAALPASDEEQEVVAWADLSRAAEIAEVSPPDDPADEEAVVDYVQAVSGVVVNREGPSAAAILPEAAQFQNPDVVAFADEVGWNLLDVERFVERQTPPAVVTVMEGDFDAGRLTEALGEPDDGTWRAGDGEAFEMDVEGTTPARPLGQSLWFTLPDGRLTVTRSPQDSAATTQAVTGEGGGATLADDPAFAGLAGALDAESAYAAMLARPGRSGPAGAGASPEAAEAACEHALPEPTSAVATAVADDGGPVIVVALAHESEDAADANAEALERLAREGRSLRTNQPWSELVSLDGVETAGDGLVAVARLRPEQPGRATLWYQMITAQDSLITSC